VIVEKEPFPRYHIGESLVGEAGGVLRELGLEGAMAARKFLVKRGAKLYGPGGKYPWFAPVMMRDSEWNLKEQFTWQVRRSDFDHMLLEEAVGRGATLLRGQATRPLLGADGEVRGVQVRTSDNRLVDVESDMLLDCSGQATFLANLGLTGPKYRGNYDKQIAIFSQATGGIRDDGRSPEDYPDNTLLFTRAKFHWAWWIPLDHEVVSVGVVIPAAYFLEKKESKRVFLLRELREINPDLARRLPEINLVEDVHVIPNYSYQVRRFCGKGFLCVGDAHRFIDPIFSFGVYVTMKEAAFAAQAVKGYFGGENRDTRTPFAEHQRSMEQAIDLLEDILDGFWEQPFAFAAFVQARHRGLMIDLLAGRIYERQPSDPVLAFRKMLQRERTFGKEDDVSVPIGSRFHPERAPIWEANSGLESTEQWMGPR
jgi:FADH2-dependent halogenase